MERIDRDSRSAPTCRGSATVATLATPAGSSHDRTTQAVTVGAASAFSLDLVRGLGLDLYQIHWYDKYELRTPLDQPVAAFALDRPVLLGEFPTRGSRCSAGEILATARGTGYAGALGWPAAADDEASDRGALLAALSAL